MKEGFTQNYRQIAPPKGGLRGEGSQKTPLARSVGKISLNCELCGLVFETFACWAKRNRNHFCSRACKEEWDRVPVEITCKVCGNKFVIVPSRIKDTTTCSPKCKGERVRLQYAKQKVSNAEVRGCPINEG